MSLLNLVAYGPADIYFTDATNDYNIFMKSTEDEKEKVSEERTSVIDAFMSLTGGYRANGLVKDDHFCEKHNNFQQVLNKAIDSCHHKGVQAKSSLIEFFKVEYINHTRTESNGCTRASTRNRYFPKYLHPPPKHHK
jgi:hypothetical protein